VERTAGTRRCSVTTTTILVIILILILIGALPLWPYSSGWGYYPGGAVGVILLIVIILLLTGRL
jgi:low affinity Fe/Cu permease